MPTKRKSNPAPVAAQKQKAGACPVATKDKATPATKKTEKVATVESSRLIKDEKHARTVAKMAIQADLSGAVAMKNYLEPLYNSQNIDVSSLHLALRAEVGRVRAGSLEPVEEMLFSQAHALQAIFSGLAEKAARCTNSDHYEMYLRIALRSQAQCRATLQTLAEVKNPPMIWAKQANVVNGQQQVNVGTPAPAREAEPKVVKNELFEGSHHEERMDPGTPCQAGTGNPAMEAMAAVNGTAKHRR